MERLFRGLGIFIQKRFLIAIAVAVALILPASYGASRLTTSSGDNTFISPDSQLYQNYLRFSQNFSGSTLVVLMEAQDGNELLKTYNINAMNSVGTDMSMVPGVKSVISPAFFVRLAVRYYSGFSVIPPQDWMIAAILKDPATGQVRPDFASVFPDQNHALMAIQIDGNASTETTGNIIAQARKSVSQAGFRNVEPIITGDPTILQQVDDSLSVNLRYTLLVASLLMLAILTVVFNVRNFFAWRWLPLGIVAIALIYGFGVMGWLSIPITMVTMAAFPVLLGLGVDYAIQFFHRYDEEARRCGDAGLAIVRSTTHIGHAIGIAIIAASLGFTALFFSPVPMIRDFGYTLIIGIVMCYFVAVFLLMPILYWYDRRKGGAGRPAAVTETGAPGCLPEAAGAAGFIERSLRRAAPRVIGRPLLIAPIALVLSVAGLIPGHQVGTQADPLKFLSADMPAVRNIEKLQSVTGGRNQANIFVEGGDFTEPNVLKWIDAAGQRIKDREAGKILGVNSIVDVIKQGAGGQLPSDSAAIRKLIDQMPPEITGNLVNSDYTAANIVLDVSNLSGDQLKELNNGLAGDVSNPPPGLRATVTGSTVIQDAIISGLTQGREKMTLIGICFVFIGLLLLFRLNVIKALLAVLPIGLIIGWSSITMSLLGIDYSPLTAMLGALIIGTGVEFTVLLMMRYYEERGNGEEPLEAMTVAMAKIGRAIIASGLTVIAGFGALLIARDFPVLQEFGEVTMLNVLFALISTLVVLPPLIVLADSRLSRRALEQSLATDSRR
ncbi:MAG: hydrophobe/amphiphile efflux-3 (HAE3) family transporter [Actinobacteria bacterium]|nr:hydrophobe/amphiphile efflux-3 (HAE3) family transporter [Actinomycetota bacterium]MCL5882731.1 hydrophobe/amphiphile efflux-3 (HAE3) family transporter [Actinomycetota bacterium]